MNSNELKKKLIHLSQQPLEQLSSVELKKFFTQLSGLSDALERMTIIAKVDELSHSIALENKPFYSYLLKKFSTKRPSPAAKREAWEKYLLQYKLYLETCKQKKNEYTKTLASLQKLKEDKALKLIKKMKPEEKKLLSLLASLTERKARGVGSLALGTNLIINQAWLRELKNVKHLGVLHNENL
jgi:hypothetical protein